MVKFNKKNLLNLDEINNPPLLHNNSKGGKNKIQMEKKKAKKRIKKIKYKNEMQIPIEEISKN